MAIDIKKLFTQNDVLENKNANWRDYHQDLADFCLPRKAWQTTIRTIGERLKLNHLFDSTAIRSLKIMAAGFHSNLTNPASKWFQLQTRDLSKMKSRAVQIWFKTVEDRMFSVLNASNFDTTFQEFYVDSGCFGTGVVFTEEDPIDKVRFKVIPMNGINFEEDTSGRVDRVYRSFKYTVQQAFDLWGKRAGEVVTEKIKNKPQDMVDFMHYVGPREVFNPGKVDSLNMPFESIWAEKSKKHLISEGGFQEFPYSVGRFYKDPLETFGFSPAMDVFADIKLINAQQKTLLRSAMKIADPPVHLPGKGFLLPLNFNPGALNYRDNKLKPDSLAPIPVSGNIPITLEVMDKVQKNVEAGFFVPLFRAISDITKQMTIPEVQRRIAENLVLLGPVVGRFTDEVLDPTVLRVFAILFRNGEFPLPPEEIQGEELEIVYISPLAKVQRSSEIFEIESFLADVSSIAAFKPAALDKINEDAVVDVIAKIKNVSPEILHDDKVVAGIREQKAAVAEEEKQAALAAQGAQTIKTGAEAGKVLQEA